MSRRFGLVSLWVLVPCLALSAWASQVRGINLEQMTARAGRVFSGRCVAVQVTRDPALDSEIATVSFEVARMVKGEAAPTLTIRMLVGDDVAARGGAPPFRPGEEVVLFLYQESSLGLTSPIGMGQGHFTVVLDKRGRAVAVNTLANRNLLENLTEQGRQRLGSALETWRGRDDLDRDALIDMADALKAP